MNLEQYIDVLVPDIAFWMLGLRDATYPVESMGRLSIELSEKLRALAVIVLLSDANSDRYYHNLIRSAKSRLIYLERLKKEAIDNDHHQSSGRYNALLDAVAAGEFDLAKRIVSLSPREWCNGHEYEDDYCYAQILHRLVQDTPPTAEIQALLTQFAAYLDGEPNARFEVCKALMEKDETSFDETFEALLAAQEMQIEQNKERGQLEEPIVIANRLVFVEGLAILRLADKQGLKTQSEYRYCPSLARVPMKTPFAGE